jgi:hypothetical protein
MEEAARAKAAKAAVDAQRIQDYADEIIRKRKAKVLADSIERGPTAIPDAIGLTELMATEYEVARYRVEHNWPTDGRVVLAAAAKAGKSTLVGNLVMSLADQTPFLGVYKITPLVNHVVVIDNEMSPRMLSAWYSDIGVDNSQYVKVYTLRGQGASFNILDDAVRAEWVTRLRQHGGTDVLILDCLAPALSALDLTETNEDVGRFLSAFDALKREADISETMIVHHMGHSSERSRGASRLRDWPDVEWRYVREQTEEGADVTDGARFYSAYGRDVDVSESKLVYTPYVRRLRFAGGTRKQDASMRHLPAVEAILTRAWPTPIPTTMMRDALKEETGVTNNAKLQEILRSAVHHGIATAEKQGTKILYALVVRTGT